MKRLILASLLFIGLTAFSLQAQEKQFPEGLQKLSNKEMMDVDMKEAENLPAYGPDGTFWSPEKVNEMSGGMKYIPEFYANKNGKVVAIKYREITKQEKAMFAQFEAERKRMEAMIGKKAQHFAVKDINGEFIKLSKLKGSVVAINFWFIGCKPCIMEMPELNHIVKEFEGKPVKFVAIALDKESALQNFTKRKQFDYDIVPDGREITERYKVSGYPTHCIVDQEGKIAYFKSGYSPMTAEELTKTLNELLKD